MPATYIEPNGDAPALARVRAKAAPGTSASAPRHPEALRLRGLRWLKYGGAGTSGPAPLPINHVTDGALVLMRHDRLITQAYRLPA